MPAPFRLSRLPSSAATSHWPFLMIRGLDLPKWRRLAGRLVTDGRVLKVNDERGYIRALSIFHTEEDEVGRKLVVDHGIALEMIARGEVGRALVAGLEEEARKLG